MSSTSANAHLITEGNIYCPSLVAYKRRETIPVQIGELWMGSDYPIRVQSMTTVDTMDTQGSIEQAIRMIDAGCEIVRITAPSVKEAQNLENIRKGLREKGFPEGEGKGKGEDQRCQVEGAHRGPPLHLEQGWALRLRRRQLPRS